MPALAIDVTAKYAAVVDALEAIKKKATDSAKSMEKAFNQVNSAFSLLGVGLSAAAIVGFFKSTIDAADKLNDLKTRTGASAQELLVLQGAAVRSGVEMEAISDIASKLSKNLRDAKTGTGDAALAFAQLGVKVTDSNGNLKSVNQILTEVGRSLNKYEDNANKASVATAALGKGGDRLIPVVQAIDETAEHFKKLGITISDDALAGADKFNDTMEDVKSLLGVLGNQILVPLLPHLQNFADVLVTAAQNTDGMKTAIDSVVGPIKVLTTGFLALYTAIAAAGEVMVSFQLAQLELLKGNPGRAWDEITIGATNAKERIDGLAKTVSKLFADVAAGPAQNSKFTFDNIISRIPKPSLRAAGSDAANKKAEAEAKALAEAQAKLVEARTKILVDKEKAAADGQLAILDSYHQDNLIKEGQFWDSRAAIQKTALDAELRAANAEIAAKLKLVEHPPKGSTKADTTNNQRDLEVSIAKRDKLLADSAQRQALDDRTREHAAAEYLLQLEQLNLQTVQLSGNTEAAARAALQLQVRDLTKQLGGDDSGNNAVKRFKDASEAQIEFNESQKRSEEILTRLDIAERRIRNSREAGAISEFESLKRLDAARNEALGPLQREVGIRQQIAESTNNPALKLQVDQAKAQMEDLAASADLAGDKIRSIFKDSIGDSLAEVLNGTKSVKAAFTDMANSILQQINKLAAQNLADSLFGKKGGGGAGGFGGGALDFIFGKGFGGGTGAGGTAGFNFDTITSNLPKAGVFDFLKDLFPFAAGGVMTGAGPIPLRRYAAGGIANSPQMSVFGEGSGAEAYVPLPDGRSIPVKMKGNTGSGGNTNVYFTVHANDANSFRKSQGQIMGDLSRAVRDGNRRYRF